MKKCMFFGLILVLLTFNLFLAGCNNPSTSDEQKQDNPPAATPKNGISYYASISGDKFVIVGISDPSLIKAAFAPQSGFLYAIWVVAEDDGESDPISEGTITIAGNVITFTPGTGYSGGAFTGTISGTNLIMDSIPTVATGSMTLVAGNDFDYDPDNADISFPTIPSTPGGSPGSPGSDPVGPPVGTGGDYNPGRIVTDVIIDTPPDFSNSTASLFYEGEPITSILAGTGIVIQVTYNNGDFENFNASKMSSHFTFDPPDIKYDPLNTSTGKEQEYKVFYNNNVGFTNTETAATALYDTFDGPTLGQITTIDNIESVTPSGIVVGTGGLLAEWYEDDFVFTGSASIVAKYGSGVGNRPISLSKNHQVKLNGTGTKLTVYVGTEQIEFDIGTVVRVKSIAVSAEPKFAMQVLCDDPRLVVGYGTLDKVNPHWLNRLQDARLTITYDNNKTKTLTMAEAYNNAALASGSPPEFITPPTSLNIKAGLIFTYFDKTTYLEVPVYNKLQSITVTPKTGTNPPIMVGPSDLQPEFLLSKARIYAIYQLGNNKEQTVRRTDVYEDKQGSNASCTSTISTNITYPLMQTAAISYGNGKYYKVRVELDAGSTAGKKNTTFEIGAVDYP